MKRFIENSLLGVWASVNRRWCTARHVPWNYATESVSEIGHWLPKTLIALRRSLW